MILCKILHWHLHSKRIMRLVKYGPDILFMPILRSHMYLNPITLHYQNRYQVVFRNVFNSLMNYQFSSICRVIER
jgi:hypothetical protein